MLQYCEMLRHVVEYCMMLCTMQRPRLHTQRIRLRTQAYTAAYTAYMAAWYGVML